MTAQQGHAYTHRGVKVIALMSGTDTVRVATIVDGWLGRKFRVPAKRLKPLPMAYFHHQVPT